jgi:hypothetical protein
MIVPDGIAVNLFAADPEIRQPIVVTWDDRDGSGPFSTCNIPIPSASSESNSTASHEPSRIGSVLEAKTGSPFVKTRTATDALAELPEIGKRLGKRHLDYLSGCPIR